MNKIRYLKTKKYSSPRPEIDYNKEAGVLSLEWRVDNNVWAILEVGENANSDFSFCAKGIGGSIKMQGTATQENLDIVIDFTTELMKN